MEHFPSASSRCDALPRGFWLPWDVGNGISAVMALPPSAWAGELCLEALLHAAMDDADADCRFLAIMALAGLNAAEGAELLRAHQNEMVFMLGDEEGSVRAAAAMALGGMRDAGEESVARLVGGQPAASMSSVSV